MTELKYDENFPDLSKIITKNNILLDIIKKSPSRFWINKEWYYPIQELDDMFKYFNLTKENFSIDEKVKEKYEIFKKRVELLKKFKAGDISDIDLSNPPHFIKQLKDRQKPIVAQILLMKRYLMALEVGMGKTVISLFTILKLRQLSKIKALIVCESNQIHKPWIETIFTFSDLTKDSIMILDGTSEQRQDKLKKYNDNPDKYWLWIISYDIARIEKDNIPKNWDIIVYDEITKVKNISAKVSKSLLEINAPYKIGLSGTPITNTYFDLYGIMKIINPYVFSTKNNFQENYLKLDMFMRPIGLQNGVEEELKRKMFPWMLEQSKEEIGIAKPIHIKTIPVSLTVLQAKALEEIKSLLSSGEKSAFECQVKLRQICNTVKLFDEYADRPIEETTNKVSVLKQLLFECVKQKNKKAVVFSFFKGVVDLLEQILSKEYKVRVVTGESKKTCKHAEIINCYKCELFFKCVSVKKYIYEFVEGDVEVLLGTDSLSRAHNLYTCDTIINFDLPWNASDMVQRFGRIDRGEKNPAPEFFVYNLATLGTIEERIIKKIERKAKESRKVFPKFSVSLSKLSSTITIK